MKDRIETKESIQQKSDEILKARARRRRAAISAACVMLIFVTAEALWLRSRQEVVNGEYETLEMQPVPPLQSDCGTESAGIDKSDEAKGTDRVSQSEQTKGINDVYTNRDSMCFDNMTIYTEPASKTVSLCAKNSEQNEYIIRLSNWISDLKTNQVSESNELIGSENTTDVVYVIEQNRNGDAAVVYVNGNRIKFDNGQWLVFSEGDRKEFDTIVGDIFNEN